MASVRRVAAEQDVRRVAVDADLVGADLGGHPRSAAGPVQVVGRRLILGGIAGASGVLDRRGRRGDHPAGSDVATPLPVPDDPDPPPVGQR